MCPSYMATRREKDTTRARANILREMITRSPKPNPFAHDEIAEVMDCPVDTVKTRMFHARRRLRQAMPGSVSDWV